MEHRRHPQVRPPLYYYRYDYYDGQWTDAIDRSIYNWACSQAERDAFEAYDKAHGVRRALVAKLQVRPPPLHYYYHYHYHYHYHHYCYYCGQWTDASDRSIN